MEINQKYVKILKMAQGKSVQKLKVSCEDVSQILRSMGHPQRLLLLACLCEGEKNVSELVELCEVSQPHLSQFLARMKSEGLVDCRREGAFQYYFIADPKIHELIKTLSELFCA